MNARIPRTQVRRMPERQVTDRAVMLDVLRAGRVAHVGVVDAEGQPRVIPVAYGVDGDDAIVLHGATSSQLFRALAAGAPVCVTVTMLDGLVVANSSFNSSMNYRCVIVFGRADVVADEEKERVLERLSEHLFPGHGSTFRPLQAQELKATKVVRVPLTEMSMKSRDFGADDAEDNDPQRWSGVLPIHSQFGEPIPGDHVQVPTPEHIRHWRP